jgi:hypothetical protein
LIHARNMGVIKQIEFIFFAKKYSILKTPIRINL